LEKVIENGWLLQVIAYIMKEKRWQLQDALSFVKERRGCVKPNKGFMEQLHTYEGILNAR
jgi:protein phosphatase slingshot